VGCSNIAGNIVLFPTKSVRTSTNAAVAGGCSAQGLLSKNISFPATASSILLRATWKQKINGYAIGVVGFAMAHALAWSPLELDSYDCNDWATAPFLWVDNFSREMNFDVTTDFTESKGKTYTLYFDTSSRSIAAVCCATSSSAQITYSRVDLIVTK